MLKERIKIVEAILTAANVDFVEKAIANALTEIGLDNHEPEACHSLYKKLKSDLTFQLMSKQTRKEFRNSSKALHVINRYLRKTDSNDNEE